MTLKPIPKRLADALGFTFALLMMPLFCALWLADWWDRTFGPSPEAWQRWFAWTPTTLGTWDGPVVWMEPVERARWGNGILYRRPGDARVRAPWEIGDE